MVRRSTARLAVVVGVLAMLAGCTADARPDPEPTPTDASGLPASWREQAAVRAADLTFPGSAFPVLTGPIDPEPSLYADAVRLLAVTGKLAPQQRDRAVTLITEWWPTKPGTDEDGFRWLALARALGTLEALDELPADRLAPPLRWVRSTLAAPDSQPRPVLGAAQLARQLLDGLPADPSRAGLPALVAQAAARLSCDTAVTMDAAAAAAVVATVANRACALPAAVRAAAQSRLTDPGTDPQGRLDTVASLAPLAAVDAVDRAVVIDVARGVLSALSQPEYDRGGDIGQSAVVTVIDALITIGGEYDVPANQVETLRRVLRSESRLADGVGEGDPLETALAVDLLRRLGRPAPGPVDWEAPLPLADRAILALAYDRRRLPSVQVATEALKSQPASTMTLGYLTAAYPGLCTPTTAELRASLAAATDLARQASFRLYHTALMVAGTAGCDGAQQRDLVDTMLKAIDVARTSPPSDAPALTIVDMWYFAEAGCLLGERARYLPAREALHAAVVRDVGLVEIKPHTTVKHLYAAMRLGELVAEPAACASPWWSSNP